MLRSSRAKAAPLEKLAIAIDDAIVVIMVKMLCGCFGACVMTRGS